MAYLTQPNERLYFRFEHHWRTTVKLRNALVQYCVEISKNPFFEVCLAQNVNFFYLNLPFSFLAHLISPSGNYQVSLDIIGELQQNYGTI